jgi:hypothetical protein
MKAPRHPPASWKGDEVEDAPGREAERGAERAEGNTPIPAALERERLRQPPSWEQQPQQARRRAPHTDDPEQEIEETAEEHRARYDAGERPPRGKL